MKYVSVAAKDEDLVIKQLMSAYPINQYTCIYSKKGTLIAEEKIGKLIHGICKEFDMLREYRNRIRIDQSISEDKKVILDVIEDVYIFLKADLIRYYATYKIDQIRNCAFAFFQNLNQ